MYRYFTPALLTENFIYALPYDTMRAIAYANFVMKMHLYMTNYKHDSYIATR